MGAPNAPSLVPQPPLIPNVTGHSSVYPIGLPRSTLPAYQPPRPMMIGPGVVSSSSPQQESPLDSVTSSPAPEEWSEHTAADGRKYYYNRLKKISAWTKPDILKTPHEVSLALQSDCRDLMLIC